MNDVINIITNLGFPISCVIACGYYINKINTQLRNDNISRESNLMNKLDNFSDTMIKFNETLTKIEIRLEKEVGDK